MVSVADIKFYRAGADGLGGDISGVEIISGTPNNLFSNVVRLEQETGKDYYMCLYIKNTSAEEIRNLSFWMSTDTDPGETTVKYGFGTEPNQTIININTSPTGVVWRSVTSQPDTPNLGTLKADAHCRPIWIWWHVEAGAPDMVDDTAYFHLTFDIPSTGTADPETPGNPIETPSDYKIAVTGDSGCESETKDVTDLIKNGDYGLCIDVGDLSYDGSASCFFSAIKPIDDNQGSSIRFETAMGNHEYEESAGEGPYKTHFGYTKTYFSFDYQNVHILILDSNDGEVDFGSGSAQFDFAEADLIKQDTRNNIDWIFVAFHHPMYGCESKHGINEFNQVQTFMDLFIEHGVNLVLTGHNHNLQRTYPIKRNGSGATKVINDADGPYTTGDPEGWLIHVVAGAGGHDHPGSLYNVSNSPSYQKYANNTNNGILSIEASNGGQTLTCKFINTDEKVLDSWSMVKG